MDYLKFAYLQCVLSVTFPIWTLDAKGNDAFIFFLTVNNIDKCWMDESLSFIF